MRWRGRDAGESQIPARLKETGHMSFHGPASNVTVREHGNQGLPLKEGAVFLLKLKSLIKFEFNHRRIQGLCWHVEYRSCSKPQD